MKSPSAGATMAVMLLLLTFGVWLGSTMDAVHAAIDLDLAPNSVDDMYKGCDSKMEQLAAEFLEKEKSMNRTFTLAWDAAQNKFEAESKKKFQQRLNKIRNKILSKITGKITGRITLKEKMAVYAYTLDHPKLYAEFNQAVRTQESSYRTTFQYHALHFYLTTAVQRLKSKQGRRCRTVYRRVGLSFRRDVVNKPFRFGSFTSSSMDGYASPAFGKTCFKIETCFGANISKYSAFPNEHELLIPPYEVFTVTAVGEKPLPTCDVEYQVKSTGKTQSNLNCALVKKHSGSSNAFKPSQMFGL
ncbi:ecto-ADP-ribosyltransferase 5-like [Synchiropus picturatus]